MPFLLNLVPIVVAYVLGSIPSGVLASRLVKGIEIRAVGSGRTGATNAYRAAGPWGLALTSLGDILKGIAAVWITRIAASYAVALGGDPSVIPWVEALSGIAVVAGHNWSLFLGFRGGAGTATTLGVLAALNLYAGAGLTLVGILAIILSHMASIGSLTIALLMSPALVLLALLGHSPWAYVSFGSVCGAFTVYALIPNIKRILSGQERRLKTSSN
jgi:glycerol-3-phosphate acyltransferase PlsY